MDRRKGRQEVEKGRAIDDGEIRGQQEVKSLTEESLASHFTLQQGGKSEEARDRSDVDADLS